MCKTVQRESKTQLENYSILCDSAFMSKVRHKVYKSNEKVKTQNKYQDFMYNVNIF